MAKEIVSAFNDVDNASQLSIQAIFDHQEGAANFEDLFLNASNKKVRNKVAASSDFSGAISR